MPAKELLADLRRIDSNIKSNEAQMRDALAATSTTLQQSARPKTFDAARIARSVLPGDVDRLRLP